MKRGRYGNGNTDLKKYKIDYFNASLYCNEYLNAGCGSTALALLTGKSPEVYIKKDNHYPDSYMLKHLRKDKYKVFEVNVANLTKNKDPDYSLTHKNLILYSQFMSKGRASWFVAYNGYTYHNFEIHTANYYTLLNFPIHSMYLLYKPKLVMKRKPISGILHVFSS